MIQTIREQLELTRKELSFYLVLSPHMIKSVEMGRRQLPMESMAAVAALYQAMMDVQKHGPINDPPMDHQQIRRMKRLHRKCSRRLDRSAAKLEKMKKSYASACNSLRFYQLLAGLLKGDSVRLKWTKHKINEMTQRMQDNNTVAQELLTAEIAGLKGMVRALEGSQLFHSAA